MKKAILIIILCFSFIITYAQNAPVYSDTNRTLDERIEDALSRMTLEEKVAMCHAQSRFSSPGVPRLGIPELWLADGPNGVREELVWDDWVSARQTNDSCTAFPALTCLAATWNPQLAYEFGKALGEESRYREKDVILGPGINIYRTPLNGRNFEYMGEDPHLISILSVPYIQGVQINGVAACIKHLALNNQEHNRNFINVNISKRALHEIYLPGFKAAVQQGKAWTLMGAYNKLNGQYCSHNEYLLNKTLKEDWRFDGVVISDWGGAHDTFEAAEYGLDLEMGSHVKHTAPFTPGIYDKYYLAQDYLKGIRENKFSIDKLDDKVRRLLKLNFRTAMNINKPFGSMNTREHSEVALKVAEEGIVLLKNADQILPLNFDRIKTIAVIGDNATRQFAKGGGASGLKARYEISPLEGIRKAIPTSAKLLYAQGYTDRLNVTNKELSQKALDIAQKADVVIFIGGLNKNQYQECEGDDRKSYELPYGQNELIADIFNVNKNIVVVNISGSGVAMPWTKDVKSVVQAWYMGSESGNAIANVLTGKVNPSGKLPFSIPFRLEDCGAHAFDSLSYPGNGTDVFYKEDILVGYRWFDTKKIPVNFSFGHGLSYTTFDYGKITTDKTVLHKGDSIQLSLSVKNTGEVNGSEVVQLYIRDIKSSVIRPAKELKSFRKIALKPSEAAIVRFCITEQDLEFYSESEDKFISEKGDFEILIGSSATDIRQKTKFKLQ